MDDLMPVSLICPTHSAFAPRKPGLACTAAIAHPPPHLPALGTAASLCVTSNSAPSACSAVSLQSNKNGRAHANMRKHARTCAQSHAH